MICGICLWSVVAGRKEPAGASEMLTQILFGEHYTVLEENDGWVKIKNASDLYECWINAKQHTRISENTFHQLQKSSPVYSKELVQVIHNKITGTHFPISIGATLPLFKDGTAAFDSYVFDFEGGVSTPKIKGSAPNILSTAFVFLNAPYLWGGKNPFGIDCSGFTQLVYQLNGYRLPRDSQQQVELGVPLSFVEEAKAGDLAFFDNEEGRIVHVGILLDNHQIIHASGCVRIDKFDHYGIFHSHIKKYSHTLRVIKRIISE